MSGNAWEWTADRFQPGDNPNERVIKGGSARQASWAGRCSYRQALSADETSEEVGFRCCMDAVVR
jgi:formylglycine-generating enzyme required for sulfatase activity